MTNPFSNPSSLCLQGALFSAITLVIESSFTISFFFTQYSYPKEGNSIITSDTLPCLSIYRNTINTFGERHHAAAQQIILYNPLIFHAAGYCSDISAVCTII